VRRGERVQGEQRARHQRGVQPIEALHQRRSWVEPPHVNEAVVKKFHSAAISAPAMPAAQYAADFRNSHSATAMLMNAPMPQAT
jgi:hypothetical protein